MSTGWDLVPNGAGGLTTAAGVAVDNQDIGYRARTNNPEHALWSIGANLEDLEGRPNNAATGTIGVQSLTKALTVDGRFTVVDLSISAVPINANEIEFDIGIASSTTITSPAYVTLVVQLES